MIIDLNGDNKNAREPSIDPLDRGLTLGDGIFETIRVKNLIPQFYNLHMERFYKSASFLDIKIKASKEEIKTRIIKLSKLNKLKDSAVRLTLTRGYGKRGLSILGTEIANLIISINQFEPNNKPVNAMVSNLTRRNEFSPLSEIKSISYLDNIIAANDANKKGFDDAILLNTSLRVCESTISNIFMLNDNKILTPSLAEGALPGTLRRVIIENYEVLETKITLDDIQQAKEAFLTNSLSVRPLLSINGKKIGSDNSFCFSQEILSRFF